MNGLILVNTIHPVENILGRLFSIVNLGFVIDDQVYITDMYQIFNCTINRGIILDLFRQDVLITKIMIKKITQPPANWRSTILPKYMNWKSPSIEDLVSSLFGGAVQQSWEFVSQILEELKLTLEDFEPWYQIPLETPHPKTIQKRIGETLGIFKIQFLQAMEIFMTLSLNNGIPDIFPKNNPYKDLCIKIFTELDNSIKNEVLNLENLEDLKNQFLSLDR